MRRPRRHRTGERGETLVELLFTVSIMGIAFVAVLAGVASAISLSANHRGQASADVIAVSAAEQVKKAGFKACSGASVPTSSWNPLVPTADLPSGWTGTLAVTSVTNVDGSPFTCSATLQRVTITATSPDTRSAPESIDVVLRKP